MTEIYLCCTPVLVTKLRIWKRPGRLLASPGPRAQLARVAALGPAAAARQGGEAAALSRGGRSVVQRVRHLRGAVLTEIHLYATPVLVTKY
eukprot:SAG25_NODE_782_length_5356_cov_9.982880_5_plen_91_part_00